MRIVVIFGLICTLLSSGLVAQQGRKSATMGTSRVDSVLFGGPSPTPAPPRPTLTPITWTLDNLTSAADSIAEVELMPVSAPDRYRWQSQDIVVRKWLNRPDDVMTNTLTMFWWSEDYAKLPASYKPGSTFILFMSVQAFFPYMYPDYGGPVDPCSPHYRATLIGGAPGQTIPTSAIFELTGNRVAYAGIAKYRGWTTDAFERAILADVTRSVSQPPDPTPAELTVLARKSEAIADVDVISEDAGVGHYFAGLYVRKWYKQSLNMNDDIFHISYGANAIDPYGPPEVDLADGGDHRIVFLGPGNPAGGATATVLDVYGIDDGRVVSGKIDHYMGWTRERFEAALQAALPESVANPPVNMATLARQADAVAIVHMDGQGEDKKSRVKEWLLNPPSAGKGPASSPTIVIPISITHRASCMLPTGDRDYLVFLHEQPKEPHVYDYNRYQIIGGHIGVFELNPKTIGYAGLPHYSGVSRDLFEVAIRRLVTVLATTRRSGR